MAMIPTPCNNTNICVLDAPNWISKPYSICEFKPPPFLPILSEAIVQKAKSLPGWQMYYDLCLRKVPGTETPTKAPPAVSNADIPWFIRVIIVISIIAIIAINYLESNADIPWFVWFIIAISIIAIATIAIIIFAVLYFKSKQRRKKSPKAGVKVYIWDFGGKSANENWGHASMELSDETYISWRPSTPIGETMTDANFQCEEAFQHRTLQEDIKAEGKNPDDTILLDKILDEQEIKVWWKKFKRKNKFNDLRNNCSTVVFYALKAGGALKYVKDPKRLAWYPNEIQRFTKKVVNSYKKASMVPSNISIEEL